MQFEVLGRQYVLEYLDDEERWALFRPGPDGIEQIPLTEDSAQREFRGVIIPFGEGQSTVN